MNKKYIVPQTQVFDVRTQEMMAESLTIDPNKTTNEALVKEEGNAWDSSSDVWDENNAW